MIANRKGDFMTAFAKRISPRPRGLRKDKATGKWYMPPIPAESQEPQSMEKSAPAESLESPSTDGITPPHKRKPKPVDWRRNDIAMIGGRTVLILGRTKYDMIAAQTLDGERLIVEEHRVESISQWTPEEEESDE